MQRRHIAYMQNHPGVALHVNDIAADLGVKGTETSTLLSRLVKNGLVPLWRVAAGTYMWGGYPEIEGVPVPEREEPYTAPELPPSRRVFPVTISHLPPVEEPEAYPQEDEGSQEGAAFRLIGQDSSGHPIIRGEDGTLYRLQPL